jgi:GNAT superfamily N-acetyltransferase
MALELRTVESKADLKRFVQFPLELYRDSPYWVPPLALDDLGTLDLSKNPAGEFCDSRCWLAYRDGKAVGRIAAIVNNAYVKKWGKKLGRFGWFDVADDFEAAKALLSAAEAWVKAKGLEGIHGPLGFTDLDREGMLIEGFDQRGTMATNYNHAYYPAFLERLGYAKDVDWIEFIVRVPEAIPEKVLRVNELIAKRTGVTLFSWEKPKDLVKRYGDEIFDLLDEAYAGLYGTTPLTRAQVQFYIKQYLGFVDPRFTKVIIDENKKLIGFGISMPSLSDALMKSKGRLFPLGWYRLLKALKKPEVIDMALVAVKPEYQSRGVIAILMTDLNRSAMQAGVKYAESNPELETNLAVQQLWKDYERRQHKRRRVYIKAL